MFYNSDIGYLNFNLNAAYLQNVTVKIVQPNGDTISCFATGDGGVTDEIYVFRPDGSTTAGGNISSAHFSPTVGRTEFNNYTNPHSFYTQTSNPKEILATVQIENIRTEDNWATMKFDVCFCTQMDINYANTSSLPSQTNALNTITTGNNVAVKNTDNVKFEAGSSISINSGFTVESGAIFQMNIKKCGLK